MKFSIPALAFLVAQAFASPTALLGDLTKGIGGSAAASGARPGGAGAGAGAGAGGAGGAGGNGGNGNANYDPCPDTVYGVPQCCDASVLNILDINCVNPAGVPTSAANFQSTCAAAGRQPKCCVLPLATLGVLCNEPIGVTG